MFTAFISYSTALHNHKTNLILMTTTTIMIVIGISVDIMTGTVLCFFAKSNCGEGQMVMEFLR